MNIFVVFAITCIFVATTSEKSSRKKCKVNLSNVRSNLLEVIPVGICNDEGYNRVAGGARAATTNNDTKSGRIAIDLCIYAKTIEAVLPPLSKNSKGSIITTIIACSNSLDFCDPPNTKHIGTCTGTVASRLAKDFTKDLDKNCAKVNHRLKSISGSKGATKLQNSISKNVKSCITKNSPGNSHAEKEPDDCFPLFLPGCDPDDLWLKYAN